MTTPGWDSSNHKIGPPGVAGTGGLGSQIDNFFKSLIAIPLKIAEFVFVEVPKLIIDTLSEFSQALFSAIFPFASWNDKKDPFENFRDGQLEINDRIDLISPLLNYACVYMPKGLHVVPGNWGRMPFSQQLGPVRGVAIEGDGLVLKEKGLWDIRAHIVWEHADIKADDNTEAIIVAVKPGKSYNPNDHDVKNDAAESDAYSILHVWNKQVSAHTDAWSMTLVVPEPGYKIEVWARGSKSSLDNPRHLIGSTTKSRLAAQQISFTTANDILPSVQPLNPANR